RRLRVGSARPAGELSLARGTFFHVPREGIPVSRTESVGQQARELLVGGAEDHELGPRTSWAEAGSLRPALVVPGRRGPEGGGYGSASSFWISSWSICCPLLLAT